MPARLPILALTALTAATLVTGCSRREAQADGAPVTATDGPASAPADDAGTFNDGKAMALAITQSHPDGVTIALESIQATPTETRLTITMENRKSTSVVLNNSSDTYLFGPDGAKLLLSPPDANRTLELPPGQKLRAELVFAGKLVQGGPATLFINGGLHLDKDGGTYPGFRIPLDLTAAAFTGDGSKKKLSRLRLLASGYAPTGPARASTITQLRDELGATDTARGTVVALPGDVLFDFNQATIRPDARPALDKLAELIAQSPARAIAVEGNTDSKGDDAYNLKLSARRAESVRDYLRDVRGVPADRMSVKGLGESHPVAPNTAPDGKDNAEGQQKNRRVEVIIGKT